MATVGVSANRMEILQIANAVAQEKSIDKKIVLDAMEEAIQKAARSRYGLEHDIRAEINPDSGETRLWRVQTIVETVENPVTQLTLAEAKKMDPDAEVGNEFREELPPFEFGRVAAQTAKQVITGKVREAERARQYNDFKDRVGEIINGTVKRVEYGHVIVDLGKAEGVIRRNDGIPRENFNTGDRVRSYLYKVSAEAKGPQIFLSRSHPSFMIALFAQEVPEVYEGVIEIKACARDPGSRAKIGVFSHDNSIDPVGACVGMRGARVQAVVSELGGEKIDIIPWSGDDATFIVNALQPAEVSKVVIDEEEGRVEVVVEESQFPLAIGRRGQNVRLASQLTGWQIDLMTEAADSERRQREFKERTDLFQKALDADETLAQLLASEGFETVEEIAYVEIEQLAAIEGFDEEVAGELQERAREYLEKLTRELDEKRKSLGVTDEVAFMENVTPPMAVKFGENGIKTIEDLAGLVPDDLVGWKEPGPDGKPKFQPGLIAKADMSREDAELFILKARVVAGWVEPKALEDALAARAAALDAEEAELDATGQPESDARTRGDELFNLKGANAAASEQS
ncbi:MAG: transcription termination factor NusA [Hyphomonadaceae bacterium]|nr:transcription termination factor NusA [Hyphomonadaceae bacterium]